MSEQAQEENKSGDTQPEAVEVAVDPSAANHPEELFVENGCVAEETRYILGKRRIKAYRNVVSENVRFFGEGQYVLIPHDGGARVEAQVFGLNPETTRKYLPYIERQEYITVPAMFPITASDVSAAFSGFDAAAHDYRHRVGSIYTHNIRRNLKRQTGLVDRGGNPLI